MFLAKHNVCQHHVVGNFWLKDQKKKSIRFQPIWAGEGKEVLSYQQSPAVFLTGLYGNTFLLQAHLLRDWANEKKKCQLVEGESGSRKA